MDRKLNELSAIEQNGWKEIQLVPAKQVIISRDTEVLTSVADQRKEMWIRILRVESL